MTITRILQNKVHYDQASLVDEIENLYGYVRVNTSFLSPQVENSVPLLIGHETAQYLERTLA